MQMYSWIIIFWVHDALDILQINYYHFLYNFFHLNFCLVHIQNTRK